MNKSNRIASIDVFRALTMLLMIWVNDFWTLDKIPKWLKHARIEEDFLGFSDIIFPWFLFIVGLSIPFAIENRLKKGEHESRIILHILVRSISLLILGFFHVNFESYDAAATGIQKPVYIILTTLAFFLVWNSYPRSEKRSKYLFPALQSLGLIMLCVLAFFYRSADGEWMRPQWWGILGLIGWTYLIAAPSYLLIRKKSWIIVLFLAGFTALNIAADRGFSYALFSWQGSNWFPGNGGLHVFAFGGILTSILLKKYGDIKNRRILYSVLLLLAILSLSAAFIIHINIPISKILGTSTWVIFSLSTAFFAFVFLHFLVDHLGKAHWFKLIKTAGTATLTCYLIPYFYYSFRTLLSIDLNGPLVTGLTGLTKSMLYALIIVGIAWMLGKIRIKLKL